jgi:hypothetical protein
MTLPLSHIGVGVFFLATLFAVRLVATQLPASIATFAMLVIVLAVDYLGPFL